MSDAEPKIGTAEYQQWLIEQSKPLIDRLFEHPIPDLSDSLLQSI